MEILQVPTDGLHKSLVNIRIYGDEVEGAFIEDVKRHGIITPIVLAADGKTIVSGHRRFQAARVLKLKVVPAVVRDDLTDPLDIEEALIVSNNQREKTTEQKAREFGRLREIEEERARRRMAVNSKENDGWENFPTHPPEPGRAREIAAKKAGFGSGRNAEKALRVVEKIDELEESAPEKAAEVRQALNKSVNAAVQQVVPKPEKVDRKDPAKVLQQILSATDPLSGQIEAAIKAHGGPSTHSSTAIRTLSAFRKSLIEWKADL